MKNKDLMILANGSEFELETGASLGRMQVNATSRQHMLSTWEQLTEENLKHVEIKNGDGLTVGVYNDLLLVSETSEVLEHGGVTTYYAMREKTGEEKRLDALEAEQAVQNGGIEDLGQAVSDLAGGGN